MYAGDQNGENCHQHLIIVINTFRIQHPSPKSMLPIRINFLFYFSNPEKYKINSVYPSKHQILHDASYTLFASFLASIIEIWLCHAWSMGWISYESDDNILKNVIIGSFVFLWRAPHFHFVHRLIHPWRTERFPGTYY